MPEVALDPPVDHAFLSGTPVFAALTGPALALVAEHLQRRVVPAGSLVVSEGESGREMFVVERGEVEILVRKSPPDDGDLLVAKLHAGDCFGEMSLLDVQPRSATVRARLETSLLVLRYRELLQIQHAHAETFTLVVMNVAREVSRRLRLCERLLLDTIRDSHEDREVTQRIFGARYRPPA